MRFAALLLAMAAASAAKADDTADYERGRQAGQVVGAVLSTEKLVDLVTERCGEWYGNQKELAQESTAEWHARNDALVRKAQALLAQMVAVNAKMQGKEGDPEFEKNFEIMVRTVADTPANAMLTQISALDESPKSLSCLQFVAQVGSGQLDIEKRLPDVHRYLQSVAVEE